MSRSATTAVVVCAAMIPMSTSTCAAAAWAGEPPPSMHADERPRQRDDAGGAHLVQPRDEGLGHPAVHHLADRLARVSPSESAASYCPFSSRSAAKARRQVSVWPFIVLPARMPTTGTRRYRSGARCG